MVWWYTIYVWEWVNYPSPHWKLAFQQTGQGGSSCHAGYGPAHQPFQAAYSLDHFYTKPPYKLFDVWIWYPGPDYRPGAPGGWNRCTLTPNW